MVSALMAMMVAGRASLAPLIPMLNLKNTCRSDEKALGDQRVRPTMTSLVRNQTAVQANLGPFAGLAIDATPGPRKGYPFRPLDKMLVNQRVGTGASPE